MQHKPHDYVVNYLVHASTLVKSNSVDLGNRLKYPQEFLHLEIPCEPNLGYRAVKEKPENCECVPVAFDCNCWKVAKLALSVR